jgi:hypothetical protein
MCFLVCIVMNVLSFRRSAYFFSAVPLLVAANRRQMGCSTCAKLLNHLDQYQAFEGRGSAWLLGYPENKFFANPHLIFKEKCSGVPLLLRSGNRHR